MNEICIIIAMNLLWEQRLWSTFSACNLVLYHFIKKHFVNILFEIMKIMSWGNLERVQRYTTYGNGDHEDALTWLVGTHMLAPRCHDNQKPLESLIWFWHLDYRTINQMPLISITHVKCAVVTFPFKQFITRAISVIIILLFVLY